MGRAAHAQVLALAPVVLVVPALVAGARPVRDLVPGQPGALEHRVGDLVASGLYVIVRVAIRVTPQRRAGLCLQGVGTYVRGSRVETEDSLEGRRPVVIGSPLAP